MACSLLNYFSGTTALNRAMAAVVRREWLTDSCRRFRGGACARKETSLLAGDTGANAELSFADAEATRRS